MKILRLALAALAALTLAGCFPPSTTNPVGSTTGQKLDPKLVGLWRAPPNAGNDTGGYFHFLPRLDGTIDAVWVQAGNSPDRDWGDFKLTCGQVGANHFINARATINDGHPDDSNQPGTIPLLYRFDAKGELLFFFADDAATKAAIKAGKIKGTVEQGDYGDAVITADAKALDAFMASPAGTALFSKPAFILKKME